jgi:hypothetical protein
LLICEPALGSAVVIDPEPGRWRRYVDRAQRAECTVQAVLCTRQGSALPQDAPSARVCPTGVIGDRVQVRLGSRVRELPVGMSEAVLRLRGLMIGVVVISTDDGGELAFLLPDGGTLIGGGRLSAADFAEPVPLTELIPDWSLGIFEEGVVYSTWAPDGVFKRPLHEEIQLRQTTRSRILRRLGEIGGADQESVARALGM